jgi:hypothetical protein
MRVSLQDEARLHAHGYRVLREPYLGPGGGVSVGYSLQDEGCGENDYLMIGSHGCVSPTRWEAVAEGLRRIDEDERHALA